MQEKQNEKERRYNFCWETDFINLIVNSVRAGDLISERQFYASHGMRFPVSFWVYTCSVSGYINSNYNSQRSLKSRLHNRHSAFVVSVHIWELMWLWEEHCSMMGMDVEKNHGRISVCDSVLTHYLLLSRNTGVQKIYKGDFFYFIYLFYVYVTNLFLFIVITLFFLMSYNNRALYHI